MQDQLLIVTYPSEIWRILKKIGLPTRTPKFDEPLDVDEWDICQLIPVTTDGFPEDYDLSLSPGPDPPAFQFEDDIDPPHWEDSNFIQYD